MIKDIRGFIGAKDFQESRRFYLAWGFEEVPLGNMSLFKVVNNLGFYLQDAYVKDWVDNSMLFLEVEDIFAYEKELLSKDLISEFPKARISPVKDFSHGKQIFVHDPSGILWHICEFK